MRVEPEIQLTPEEREVLVKLARSGRTSVRLAQRARIVLLAGKGMRNKDIAEELCVGRVQVGRWRERYAEFRLVGIERALPRGAPGALDRTRRAAQGDPLEHAQHGVRAWRESVEYFAPLARTWAKTASGRDLEGLA